MAQRTLYAVNTASISASGVTSAIDLSGGGGGVAFSGGITGQVSQIKRAWLVAYVKGAVGGSATPKVIFTWEQVDGLGNYVTNTQLADITATGAAQAMLGVAYPLTSSGKIRWTVSGTNPTFADVDVSLVGVDY